MLALPLTLGPVQKASSCRTNTHTHTQNCTFRHMALVQLSIQQTPTQPLMKYTCLLGRMLPARTATPGYFLKSPFKGVRVHGRAALKNLLLPRCICNLPHCLLGAVKPQTRKIHGKYGYHPPPSVAQTQTQVLSQRFG